jgi:acetyl esterase/lipase
MATEAAAIEQFCQTLRTQPGDRVPIAPGVVAVESEVFAGVEAADGSRIDLTLDYYHRHEMPRRPRPAVLFLHGGGWRSGGPRQFRRQAMYLALRHDFFGVCCRYRLAHQAPFPAAIHDVKTALRWIRRQAEQHCVDPDRIAAVGGSAGAHLAALAATTGDDPRFESPGEDVKDSTAIQAAVCLNGPFDLRALVDATTWAREVVGNFLGRDPIENPDACALASPLTHVHAAMPPMLLIHGDADAAIDYRQSVRMHEALQRAGAESELIIRGGFGHGWFNQHPDFMPVLETIEAFIVRQFTGPTAAHGVPA